MLLPRQKRKQHLILRAGSYRKRVTIELPAGFKIDEMPAEAHASSDFGEFSVQFAQQPGVLNMDETLRMEPFTVALEIRDGARNLLTFSSAPTGRKQCW